MMTTTFKWMALGAALGFSVAMGVSCGPAKCTPTNCAFGCCDSAGVCATGNSDSQCGSSGNQCSQCVLGQSCQLNVCTLTGTGTGGNGGGSSGGGSGGGTGGGTSGGGSGGGGGTSDVLCTRIGNASTSFFQGRASCTDGSTTISPNANLAAQCNAGIAQCSSTNDRAGVSTLAGCLEVAQVCSSGMESTAIQAFTACGGAFPNNVSAGCAAALFGGSGGGGGGGGLPTGGGTGGGTPTGGGTGGGTPTGGGTGGGTPVGGGGGTANPCASYASRYSTIMAGRSTCPFMGAQLNASPSLASSCSSACNTNDQALIQSVMPCLNASAVCSSNNEGAAFQGFLSCTSDAVPSLTPSCQAVLNTVSTGGTGGGGGGVPTGGGTGGGTPVGGGTGGGVPTGGGTGCTTISSFPGQRTDGNYISDTNFEFTSGLGASTAADPTDLLGMEVIWGISGVSTGVLVPATRNLANEGTYNSCLFCATLRRNCTTTGTTTSCPGGTFLGRSGNMTVQTASRASTGSFVGSLSNVRFDAWNLQTDTPVTGGGCVIVTSGSITATVAP